MKEQEVGIFCFMKEKENGILVFMKEEEGFPGFDGAIGMTL